MKKHSFLLFPALLILLAGCETEQQSSIDTEPEKTTILTEEQARTIAETNCIKGGESLAPGYYNENTKTWWFDANLNVTKEGCNPACVVFEETETTEINWRCTGLLLPEADPEDVLQKMFQEKYPKYDQTLAVRIDQQTNDHIRGGIIFEAGAPGGIFLAAKIDDSWQIVFDGNGAIPCDLTEYGFPEEMLSDCTEE